MLSPGNVVERYEVERELGGGGMARVYKVRHVALGSVHALKVLDPELVVNPELRARFLDEGRIQARLKHPNILGITDVVAAPGVAGLVMDYLEGESLDKYLARVREPPDADEVRDIFLQALAGMGFAHAQGVIHRDLKPSNIFLEQVHGRRVVRILDFGIAKVSGPEGKAATRTGVRMGTPQYMSPEQIRGARDVTIRSDIFSLGVTLYELATGHVCFQGESDFNIMEKVVRAEFVPPEVAHPGIERRLLAVIRRAMNPDPEQRFGSCQEFAAALVAEARPEPLSEPVPEVREEAPVPAPPAPVTGAPIPGQEAFAALRAGKRQTSVALAPEPSLPKPEPVRPPPEPVRPPPEPVRPPPEPVRPQVPVARVEERRPTPAVPVTAVRQAPAPIIREPTPAPIVPARSSAPAQARARAVPEKPAPRSGQGGVEPAPTSKAWRWVLLFVLAGLAAMFGPALLKMLKG